jgi:hypothetical protein
MIQTHENAVCTHDLEVTSPTPLVARPAAYEIGQSDPGQPAAPEIGNEPARTATAPRAPEVGGESAFGQNAQPERGDAIKEYVQPASRLPERLDASRDLSNPDGCAEGGWWRK